MASLPPEPLAAASVLLGSAGGVLAVALGLVVLRAGPGRRVNRRLGALLVAEGLAHTLVLTRLEDLPAGVAKALATTHFASAVALPSLYLLFLATLGTPLVRFLRPPAVASFLVAYPAMVVALAAPVVALAPGVQGGPPPQAAGFYRVAVVLIGLVSLFGLAATLSEVRRARARTATRAKAVSYAAAFGVRDLFFALLLVNNLLLGLEPAIWPSLATFLFVPLLAHGFLRTQLLDVDLKLKWTIERGTVALVFVGLYLAASQAAQATVSARLGPAFGVAAAALLVFALVPLRRLARRVGDLLLPGVENSPGYLNRRKLDVYRAAVEQALDEGGSIGARERGILASLRDQLGLTERDASLLEYAAGAARERGPSDGALVPGEVVLGKYRIVRALGEGAHGRTYLAEQTSVGRHVVVKSLRAGGDGDAAREARAIAAARHPHVVTLHDVEPAGARVLLVMEHVEGGSLKDRLAAGKLSPQEFRRVGVGLLSALDAVHAAGGVHRDVKPSNVMLTREGEPKLADFGVAQLPGADATMGLDGGTGHAVGTIRYMSPEQAKGMRATARSDLYGAAATLYEAYTGEAWLAPEPGESDAELRMRAAAAGPFDRPLAPPPLRAWFARALDPSPERRFSTAAEARDALVEALAATA